MLEKIKELDTDLFLYLNGKHNSFFDPIMYWASDNLIWLPLFALITILLVKEYKNLSISILIVIVMLIASCEQLTANLISNTVKRLRPSHEPALQKLIHLSEAGPGNQYALVSSQAANIIGLTAFLFFLLPKKYNPLKWIFGFCAFLVAYSRIYNGLQYPIGVILAGFIGTILAFIAINLLRYIFIRRLSY
ncbi:MAG TPA: phosphatase PAP2 family protein [Flavobacterium sp.]|uniref:phosphatase PAP2 family protein n=1 Tax=Flavobacterium sp. TaxID=239 RepID=UPI002D00F2AD|nr:phosphatase PAP2 family protein [Flavobacterium sp.]HNP32918.1 phosphatase PAP2 family protein [Flavobacterium sp.]